MQITFASEPAPSGQKGPMNADTPRHKGPMNGEGRGNEDLVVVGQGVVVVLDGATAPAGVESGCAHSVGWLVGELAAQLVPPLVRGSREPLADLLAEAIKGVGLVHEGTCDLSNPDSPSSTVSIVRAAGEQLDYLVLADSPVVMRDRAGRVEVVLDDRVGDLPEYTLEAVRRLRNQPGGFWAASTAPDAAYEALSGSRALDELDAVAVLTDGASRYAERYGHSWSELLELLEAAGPAELIRQVHEADRVAVQGLTRGKQYDDASAVFWRLDQH